MRHVLAGILKIIAVAVLLVGVCFYVVVNYSELTQELTCKGYWKELGQNKEVAEVAHVRLTEYRWWVHLWSENDGNVQAQHGRYVAFQMAEVAIPRQMFQEILRLIAELRPQPPPAPA